MAECAWIGSVVGSKGVCKVGWGGCTTDAGFWLGCVGLVGGFEVTLLGMDAFCPVDERADELEEGCAGKEPSGSPAECCEAGGNSTGE